jgi:hypothetical protein
VLPSTFSLTLDQPATHVGVAPGGTIILRGSYHSTFDGSVVDAATTTWPAGAPGGGSIDPGGLIDFEAGGFHVIERNPTTHEVHAVATDDAAPTCATYGMQSPCLPLRVHHQAVSRLLTVRDWTSSLKGGIQVQVVASPAYAPVTTFASKMKPALMAAGVVVALVAAVLGAWMLVRKWTRSARVQLLRLATRVRDKAARADPILAAPLTPALESALRAIREKRVEPGSDAGRRVHEMLVHVDRSLDEKAAKVRVEDEQRAADDLLSRIEIAMEAAGEADQLRRARR